MENEPKGEKLIYAYKKNYNIPNEEVITEKMILNHWELEKNLTKKLLNSNKENRWEIFEECYSILYGKLDWLNKSNAGNQFDSSEISKNWVNLIGEPPQKIYEVGSGKGELIRSLAELGYKCRATEITRERGKKHVTNHPNLSWGISDGIHLDKFENINYDVVISNQVIEHMHPEDVHEHFNGVFSILSSGGRYIFTTPHKFGGPFDISRVFNCDEPKGMHLKEYTYREMKTLLLKSGFVDIQAVAMLPPNIYRKYNMPYINPKKSSWYFHYLCLLEKCISFLKKGEITRMSLKLLMFIVFNPNITLIARKD